MTEGLATTDTWLEAERLALAEAFVPQGLRRSAEHTARRLGDLHDHYPRALQATLYAVAEMARGLGMSTVVALQYMCVINGRVCLYSDAPMGLAMRAAAAQTGKPLQWDHRLVGLEGLAALRDHAREPIAAAARDRYMLRAGVKPATYRASVFSLERGGQWFTEIFDTEDARRARLLGKAGPWSEYPQRMLFHRARTYAVRNVYPDAMCGLLTAEEVLDMGNGPGPEPPHDPVDDPIPVTSVSVVEQLDALERVAGVEPDEAEPAPELEPAPAQGEMLKWERLVDIYKKAKPRLPPALRKRSLKQFLKVYLDRPYTPEAPAEDVRKVDLYLMAFVGEDAT